MELFKVAFENSSMGMALVSPEGKWLRVNEALCSSLGYGPEEFLTLTFQDITHPEDLSLDLGKLQECLDGSRSNYSIEKRYFHKKGHIVWARLSVTAVREDSKIKFFISEILDISEQKKAQEKLMSNSKLAALGEMAAGISHEINNPLTVIEGNATILRMELRKLGMASPAVEKRVKNITNTVKRISSIVNGMRSFARKEELSQCSDNSTNEVLEESLNLCKMKLKELGIDYQITGQQESRFLGRRLELSQVLLNLISNSIHALQDVDKKLISFEITEGDEEVSIKVMDNGPALCDEAKEKMMEPFFTTKPPGVGTGLGLSLSREMMEDMGGSLVFLPEEKQTTFLVSMPKAKKKDQNVA